MEIAADVKGLEENNDKLWSRAILLRDPMCKSCGIRRSTDARHILNRRHKNTRWSLLNGRGGCRECHQKETKASVIKEIGQERYDRLQFQANQPYDKNTFWLEEQNYILRQFIGACNSGA